MIRLRPGALTIVLLLHTAIVPRGGAEPPAIGILSPAGGQQGSEFEFTASGKSGEQPVTVSSDPGGVTITQDEKKRETYQARIAPDAPPGPHLLWFRNSDGVAAPRIFMVGRHPEHTESEPNNSSARAQTLPTLPATINGSLEKSGDIDCFRVEVTHPGWLIASATAYSIDSPIDPLLHLRGPNGQRIAFANDGGRRLDPLLAWEIGQAGAYTLEIAGFAHPPNASIQFSGSASCVYRLTISTGPWIHSVIPLAVGGSGETELQLRGWNAPDQKVILPPGEREASVRVGGPPFENTFHLETSGLPELLEESVRQPITFPSAITGLLARKGEVDRFVFSAAKDQRFRFEVHSARLGYPVDAVLQIESSDGAELARADDTDPKKRSGQDASLDWSAKEDGEYALVVSDLLERGGEHYLYRLVAQEDLPDFSASTESFSLVVEAGSSAELKVSANRRNGYAGKLRIDLPQLPTGVTIEGGEVPEKGGEVTLKISATPDASPHQSRIPLRISEIDAPDPGAKPVEIHLKGATTEPGDLLINRTEGIWITVKPTSQK